MQQRSNRVFASCKSIKDAVIPNTSGYDIHYLIPEGEDKHMIPNMLGWCAASHLNLKTFGKPIMQDHDS